jgi:hypothetical protein
LTYIDALDADRRGDDKRGLLRAIELYEGVVGDASCPVEGLLNLAVIYWRITDFGFWTARELDGDLVARAGPRVDEILEIARSRFPSALQPLFWSKYIAWADLGEPLDTAECAQMLVNEPSYLEPAMYLVAVSEGKEARTEASSLLEQASRERTCRARYVCSVVESALRQASWLTS